MVNEVLGVHWIADLCDCNTDLLNDSVFISKALSGAVEYANATLLEEVKYEFTPQGITAVCLLAESHISIHTWPEKSYAAVDIFTCGDHTAPEKACNYMASALESRQPKMILIQRGI